MKRVKLAVAILLSIPVLIALTHLYLSRVTAQMNSYLRESYTLAEKGDNEQAKEKLEIFQTIWKKNDRIIATFIRHSELDTANLAAAKLLPLLENNEKGEFIAESQALELQFRHIWESEKFTFDNVL